MILALLWSLISVLATCNILLWILMFCALLPEILNSFVKENFSSKVSLSTVLLVLFSVTHNTALLNLHARQQNPLQNTINTLLTKSERSDNMDEDQLCVCLGIKLDNLAKALNLYPYKNGKYKGKLKPVSHVAIKPVLVICPDSAECEEMSCKPWAVQQYTKLKYTPKVTLIKGSEIYKNCTKCKTILKTNNTNCTRVYLNSAAYLKVAAYTEYWNNSFGNIDPDNSITISWWQIWQAFIQESIRTVAAFSGINLELKDGLSIDDVTKEAYSILGENGIIQSANNHACSDTSDIIAHGSPAAVLGMDDNRATEIEAREIDSESQATNKSNLNIEPMDADHSLVNMVVVDGIQMVMEEYFVHSMKVPMGKVVECIIKNYFSASHFYCVETICAPRGLYPTEDSRPDYVCIDKACMVLRSGIGISMKTTRFIVDSYHYINHCKTDFLCHKWCNPAPLDGSAPNLVVGATGKNGEVYYKQAFNTQACEQLNAWLGGFESILKRMTPSNFNWFLHTKKGNVTEEDEESDIDE
ncbi:hypothetical protein BDQ12DRAFT_699783 [Crucibulum laeve]|uniref:Uncharacterized protein n=1 Tax=Crucibulum laeve TaxID=68775 RepID=A0A5C3LSA3_9AGAR|nr:hypothetical protein BDQ12DRAFT_699783 [Crucibulum laeve]